MELQVLKELFEANLDPIRKNIQELKNGQIRLIEIISIQSRHDEAILNLKKDVDDCTKNVKNVKDGLNNKMWDTLKIIIAGFLGSITTLLGSMIIKSIY